MSGDPKQGSETSEHFKDRAIGLITGVIADVADAPQFRDNRNLVTVRDVITSSNGQNLFRLAEAIVEASKYGGANRFTAQRLARYAAQYAEESKEVQDVISTADRYTSWVGNETIAPSLCDDGVRFAAHKERVLTTYIILPAEYMEACGRYFAVLLSCAINEMWRGGRGKVPVLLILDEFGSYGSLQIFKMAMSMARKYGIQLLVVLQELGQLEAMYGRGGWASFVNGASFKMFMRSDDSITRDYIEKMSGKEWHRKNSASFSNAPGGASSSITTSEIQLPDIAGYEVGRLKSDEMLLMVDGMDHIQKVQRAPYYDANWYPEFRGLYDIDPYERDRYEDDDEE